MAKQNKNIRRSTGWINVICKVCNMNTVRVPDTTISVVCPWCIQERVGMPERPGYVPTGRPRGWHFKKYFEFDGKVYSKGKEVTDGKKIETLKSLYSNEKPTKRGKKNASSSKK